MTLAQLRAFALTARLGSMRAAASALSISEPAVSSAIAALRADLGDPLLVRAGGGLALTPGGRRLAAHAEEIVGLADRARREVAAAGRSAERLQVAVTGAFAEHAATALVDAFTRRSRGTEVELVQEPAERSAQALVDRTADVVLGLRPVHDAEVTLHVVPFLRYQRVLVAAPRHRLAHRSTVSRAQVAAVPWFSGPAGVEETSEEGRWLLAGPLPHDPVASESEAEALAAVRAGEGVVLALHHLVREELRQGTLVLLPVPGTPVQGLWSASVLGHGRAAPGARALLRFVTTPDATAAMVAVGSRAGHQPRRLPPVHVNLWS